MVRVRVELLSNNANPRPCFVYVKDSWKTVEDLETHIKRLFGLNELELYVDDCLLPSAETIDVLCPTVDIVKVKEVGEKSLWCYHNVKHEPESSHNKKERKKSLKNDVETVLEVKKRELLEATSSLVQNGDGDAMDVTDDNGIGLIVKRKRKRKHKSKKSITADEHVNSSIKPDNDVRDEKSFETGVPTSRCHIRFNEDSDVKSEDPTNEWPKPIKIEDWQEQLMNLAKENKKPHFLRQPVTNGTAHSLKEDDDHVLEQKIDSNGVALVGNHGVESEKQWSEEDVQKFKRVTSAKSGDMIFFQKTYMSACCPTMSTYILALVEEINDNILILKILEGLNEEFFTTEEIDDSENSKFIVRLNWDQMVEPRLVDDVELMEKYL